MPFQSANPVARWRLNDLQHESSTRNGSTQAPIPSRRYLPGRQDDGEPVDFPQTGKTSDAYQVNGQTVSHAHTQRMYVKSPA
jgi:hypothetical protein